MNELTAASEKEAFEMLLDDARSFVSAGGRLSREEWSALQPLHRRAFKQAGDERAERLANSIAFSILEQVDQALLTSEMEAAMDRVGAA